MYWRGETFYTANEIYAGPYDQRTVFLGDKNQENLKDYLAATGASACSSSSSDRAGHPALLLPADARASLRILESRNNKFYLAVAKV